MVWMIYAFFNIGYLKKMRPILDAFEKREKKIRGRPRAERPSILPLGRGRGALDDSFHDPVDLGLTYMVHHHFSL